MKVSKKLFFTALALMAFSASIWAQAADSTTRGETNDHVASPERGVTAADVRALQDALAAQQLQIQRLTEQIQKNEQNWQETQAAAVEAAKKASALQAQSNQQQEAVGELRSDLASLETVNAPTSNAVLKNAVLSALRPGFSYSQDLPSAQNVQAGSSDERIRNLERQIKGIGPLSFSGDIRLRAEPFFGGPSDQSLDRMRARVRARFNAIADLGKQFRAGFSLASGDINDPTTTNQTLTGFYTRKAIALDQAFVEFTPSQFKALTLTGGKFRYPWYNTELTWDKDLNPEGAAQTLAFQLNTPVLKRIALVGFELPFAEVAGISSTNKRISQNVTYGGQLQTKWQLGSRLILNAYSGFYDYRNADSIALALARANSKNPQTPLTGLLPLGSGNPVQDSTYTTTAATVITIAGKAYPTGVGTVTNSQFASRFGLFDNIARLDIDSGNPRWPVAFIGDYVQNIEACGNLAKLIPVPANTATQTFKETVNAPCDPHQRRGYWAEGRVGRLKEKRDLQFGYTRLYIEREAVVGNLNYSDIRQGSNVTQHRFDIFYQFDKNVQLGFTALVGRPLATTEPWLTRLQFDTVYIF
jgi:hypothetical protein